MNKNNFKYINLFRGYGRLKEESLYPRVGIIKNFNIIAELEEENEHLKNNWNKLKEWLDKYIENRIYANDVERWSAYKVTLEKMQELEKGEENG